MSSPPQEPVGAEKFLAWANAQESGRYELVRGLVVAKARERAGRNLVKLAVARELGDAVTRAGVPCTVFTDGMSLAIDAETVREPDAAVQCSGSVDLNSAQLVDPMIVVEVVSPSSERDDTVDKLVEYFSVESVRHYLIVRPDRGLIIHHSREAGSKIATQIVADGTLALDPPGLQVSVARMLGRA